MDQQEALFIFVYSTIFILHISNDRVFHHQELIVVYCITQLGTIVRMCPAAFGLPVGPFT